MIGNGTAAVRRVEVTANPGVAAGGVGRLRRRRVVPVRQCPAPARPELSTDMKQTDKEPDKQDYS